MRCPNCNAADSQVADSRPGDFKTRVHCDHCGDYEFSDLAASYFPLMDSHQRSAFRAWVAYLNEKGELPLIDATWFLDRNIRKKRKRDTATATSLS